MIIDRPIFSQWKIEDRDLESHYPNLDNIRAVEWKAIQRTSTTVADLGIYYPRPNISLDEFFPYPATIQHNGVEPLFLTPQRAKSGPPSGVDYLIATMECLGATTIELEKHCPDIDRHIKYPQDTLLIDASTIAIPRAGHDYHLPFKKELRNSAASLIELPNKKIKEIDALIEGGNIIIGEDFILEGITSKFPGTHESLEDIFQKPVHGIELKSAHNLFHLDLAVSPINPITGTVIADIDKLTAKGLETLKRVIPEKNIIATHGTEDAIYHTEQLSSRQINYTDWQGYLPANGQWVGNTYIASGIDVDLAQNLNEKGFNALSGFLLTQHTELYNTVFNHLKEEGYDMSREQGKIPEFLPSGSYNAGSVHCSTQETHVAYTVLCDILERP